MAVFLKKANRSRATNGLLSYLGCLSYNEFRDELEKFGIDICQLPLYNGNWMEVINGNDIG